MTSRVEKAEPILALLRRHESEAAAAAQGVPSAYDVVYSGIPAENRPKAALTSYPISEVIAWQQFVVAKGARSSAAGAYQIIRKTLLDLGIPQTEPFDAACQDEAALILLDRRGWDDCEAGRMLPVDFADMLAREWASMPVQRDQRGASRPVKRGQSYYAGDGLNKAGATPEEVMAAIDAAIFAQMPVLAQPFDRIADLTARITAFEAWAASVNAALDALETRHA